MRNRTSTAVLLLLCAALLTGCNLSHGYDCRTTQADVEKPKPDAARRDYGPQAAGATSEEGLRIANERARLAEERAELEREKREFAEERLRRAEKSYGDENPEGRAGDEQAGGS